MENNDENIISGKRWISGPRKTNYEYVKKKNGSKHIENNI